jgi:hypothetical protein
MVDNRNTKMLEVDRSKFIVKGNLTEINNRIAQDKLTKTSNT